LTVINPKLRKFLSKEELEKLYPGIIVLNTSEIKEFSNIPKDDSSFTGAVFSPDGTVSVKKSNDITNEPEKIMLETEATADVRITEVNYYWYWTQDTSFDNLITIHNYGTSTASGKVIFWSAEDGYGYYKTFSNLAPNTNTTVTVPFQVSSSQSSVGVKPIVIEVRVDPDDTQTDIVRMPYDGIEKYNNDVNHLSDPDGGENLETSDLYHFPLSEGYRIISEAAVAGDNTTTPYETANKINSYVHDAMHYDEEINLDRKYTAADLWIVSHKNASDNRYIGVCDEYATLFVSFDRSLGIPSKYYYMGYLNMSNNNESCAHGISEIWDGNEWIHSDPTWNSFNNPQIYVQSNFSDIKIWNMKNADDSRDNNDPLGDQLLHFWNDFERDYLGELVKYN